MLKFSASLIWRLGCQTTFKRYCNTAAVYSAETSNITKTAAEIEELSKNKGLIAAAFSCLDNPDTMEEKQPSQKSVKLKHSTKIETQILKADDIDSLLVVAENPVISRKNALKILSVLSDWTSKNKVSVNSFSQDLRFIKLCRLLARSPTESMGAWTDSDDLQTILGIARDDVSLRLVADLSLHQAIKAMISLQQKKRRNTPLLRALSHNITNHLEVIGIKKSSDLLYAMASLNFVDQNLVDRICSDVIESLPSNNKPSVVTSIMISLSLLRYRHDRVLEACVDWLQNNVNLCRDYDVVSAVIVLGTVNYFTPKMEFLVKMVHSLNEKDIMKPSLWLDLVHSLLILGKANQNQLKDVLHPEFIERLLSTGEIPISARRKLMCIDGYLELTTSPSDKRRLPDFVTKDVPLIYSKEKALYVQSILDTFKSLVSAETFLRKECDSGMGFKYDAEFAVDSKCNPIPLEKANKDSSNVHRIAVMALDYHDMTRCTVEPLGVYHLYTKLLQLKGYKVMHIPYTEYDPQKKLVERVTYIEKRLRETVAGAISNQQ